MITLFDSTATNFTTNGIGPLPDAISCTVVEERNGMFELEMVYPISGKRYADIDFRTIILAKPNPFADPQPFRVYSISKPIDGRVTINAEHISYDMSGMSVSPFSAGSVLTAFQNMKNASVGPCPFIFWTDKESTGSMELIVPCTMRSILGGIEGSILDTYGGEYEFDKYTVKLHNHRGADRGVKIRYGKNLTDLQQDENCSNVYTAVHPYFYSEDYGLVELPEKIVGVNYEDLDSIQDSEDGDLLDSADEKIYSTYAIEAAYRRILTLDMSDQFDTEDGPPSYDELRNATISYILANNVGVPEVSLTVSFAQLALSSEYGDLAIFEEVHLCDTLKIEFPELGVDATAQCIKTTFDAIAEQYISLELGSPRSDLVSAITVQSKQIEEKVTMTALEQAIIAATNLITGQSGGYVVLNPPNNPREILIMDEPDIGSATKVWRWNSGGLGYSDNGYEGPFRLAMTMEGAINADFITAGIIDGALIKAGSVETQAISQTYRNEVTNEISEASLATEQAFVAADAYLMSVIQQMNSLVENDIGIITNNISSLQQTVAALSLAFTTESAGGINKILNSSGLNGVSDDWTYTGSVTASQDAVAESETTSGSMFILSSNATLTQEINVKRNKVYTFSFEAMNIVNGKRAYVRILDGSGNVLHSIFDKTDSDSAFVEYTKTFTTPGDSIFIDAFSADTLYLADLMLVEGPTKSGWTPAPNEIYTANVKIDRRGINITNSNSSTQTIIDNTQFAVKHRGDTVLTVNKDLTTLQKTNVLDELTIGRGKFIPVTNGLNFVLLD